MEIVPLRELLIKKTETSFERSELYIEVYNQIKRTIETTENELIFWPIEPTDLLFTEEETTVSVIIRNASRWYGVVYLLLQKDKLPARLEMLVDPQDLPGNTKDVGEGYLSGFLPPVMQYKQMPMFAELARLGKLKTRIVVYLPREKARIFTTKGSVILQPLHDDRAVVPLRIPIILG